MERVCVVIAVTYDIVCVLGVDEKSLEEISLKLIKSFLQEKTELEEQYAQVLQLFL